MNHSNFIRFAHSRRGEVLIEFGLAMVVFFMLLLGTMEFGIGVWQYNLMADLAQEGVRYGSVRGATATIAKANLGGGGTGDIRAYVQSRALGMNVSVPTLSCGTPGGTLSNCDCTSGATAVLCIPGNVMQIVVQKSFTPGTTLIPHWTINLQSTAQMMIAR